MGITVSKYSNQRHFAHSLSVSRKTLVLWLRRPDWPTRKRAPWTDEDRQIVEQWRYGLKGGENRANGTAGQSNPEREAKLALIVARREMLELQRGILAGEYVKKSVVQQQRVARILAVKQGLLDLGRRLAPKVMSIKDEETLTTIVHEEVIRLLNIFAGGPSPEEDSGSERAPA